jgi:hypothetical protein
MYRNAEQIQRDHVRTILLHRREAATRRLRDAIPEEPCIPQMHPHVMYVWRRGAWLAVAFVRLAPTRKRTARWRTKYHVQATEVVRFKTLWDAQRNGPPRDVLTTQHAVEQRITLKIEQRIVHDAIKITARGTPDMRQCEHRKGRCRRKGTWLVGYVSTRTHSRQITHRCTLHAWNDACLPATAMQIIRVQRSTLS